MSGIVTLRITTNDVSDRAFSKNVDSMVAILGGFGDVEIVDEEIVPDEEEES